MSERAIILGCRHLHYLFCIPGSENQDIHQLTDNIIKNLNRKPAFLYTIETNDAIFIDESEFASAEFLNALDNVARYVRKKNTFFGGMMVFTTMDIQQLPPIHGHPCLMSSLVLTSFHLVTLQEYVRSRTDPHLQRLITLTRKLEPLEESEMEEFMHLIVTNCTFVNSWEDPSITPDTIRILGTRKGVQTAENTYYDKIQSQGLPILTRTSEDYESLKTSHGTWKHASTNTIRSLNKLVREPEILKLHQGLLVECTFNNGTLWSNGQIGIVAQLPSFATLQQWRPFPIILAPPGVRSLPSDFYTTDSLLASGWKIVHMKPTPDLVHHCQGGLFAKRYQYGIRPMAATTIHKAMGNDYDKIVSSVCDDGINGFRLWEKAQVLVLISRVHRAKDIVFVGNKMETAQRLLQLISLQPKYALYMNYIIRCLTGTSQDYTSPIVNFPSTLPFNLCTAEYPKQDEAKNGYVYVLISISQPTTTYIGQTQNLHRRINQHNKGWTRHWTNNITLRPWTCMAYVIGFQSQHHRLYFETLWQNLVQQSYPNLSATPIQVLQTGELALSQYHEHYSITTPINKLRMIQILSPKTHALQP
jgi:predicted GIY-YIG superfamily endonuclease